MTGLNEKKSKIESPYSRAKRDDFVQRHTCKNVRNYDVSDICGHGAYYINGGCYC